MFVDAAAELGAPICHDPQDRQLVLLIKRQHFVVQQIRRSDRRLGCVQLGMCDFAVGVDIGLLVDAANAFEPDSQEVLERALTVQPSLRDRVGVFLCPAAA